MTSLRGQGKDDAGHPVKGSAQVFPPRERGGRAIEDAVECVDLNFSREVWKVDRCESFQSQDAQV
jgi:hypothetical protein